MAAPADTHVVVPVPPPPTPSFPGIANRWLRIDAFQMQVQEAEGALASFQQASDPMLARKMFVGLCFYRFSPQIRQAIHRYIDSNAAPVWSPLRHFMVGVINGIHRAPENYPFCLSEQEFTYFAKQNFGDTIDNLEGIYNPPAFYAVLVGDIIGAAASAFAVWFGGAAGGAVAATTAAAFTSAPAAIDAAAAAGTVVGRAAGTVGGKVIGHFMGDPIDAATKDRLWPRYQLEYRRRCLK